MTSKLPNFRKTRIVGVRRELWVCEPCTTEGACYDSGQCRTHPAYLPFISCARVPKPAETKGCPDHALCTAGDACMGRCR